MNRKAKAKVNLNVKAGRARTPAGPRRSVAREQDAPPAAAPASLIAAVLRAPPAGGGSASPGPIEVTAGQERLVVSAEKEIVLRCGSASITLLADGTLILKGTRLVSSSSGLNRIRGAAVKIN